MEEEEEEIDLKDVFSMIMSNIKLIIACVLIFVVLGVIYIKAIKIPKYTSSTTLILVSSASKNDDTITNSAAIATDLNVNSKLVSTYSELIKSKTVLK